MSCDKKSIDSRACHPVDTLMEEHQVILAVVDAMDQRADQLDAGDPLDAGFWLLAAEFLENFLDRCHHSKEEDVLFPVLKRCGIPEEGGPLAIMKHEHVEGRALKDRLRDGAEQGNRDEVSRAVRALCYLLHEHIAKEENVLFQMARQMLDHHHVEEVLQGFARVEKDIMGEGTHCKYVGLASQLCAESGVPFDQRRDP
jgi:hemerythrin-like domain-containing protein